MADTTIIDRLRADCETWCCQSFDPESGAECHERHQGDTDAWCYGCTARHLAHALTAAHAARDAAERAKRVTFCHFCLVKVDLNGMTPPEALDALKAHALTCPESPIVAALTTALRERDEARAKLEAARDECDRVGKCPFVEGA